VGNLPDHIGDGLDVGLFGKDLQFDVFSRPVAGEQVRVVEVVSEFGK